MKVTRLRCKIDVMNHYPIGPVLADKVVDLIKYASEIIGFSALGVQVKDRATITGFSDSCGVPDLVIL